MIPALRSLVFASLLVPSFASAAIVFFPVSPAATAYSTGGPSAVSFGSINLNSQTYVPGGTAAPGFTFAFDNQFFWNAVTTAGAAQVASASGSLQTFAYGSSIGLSAPYYESGQNSLYPDGPSYVGARLVNGADYYYGWFSVNSSLSSSPKTITIDGFAFESTPNTAILAGDTGVLVPEPSTWAAAALLAGGAAVMRWRKRKVS
jgi:hypothetical protein